jgi:hypothetical protein
VNFKTSLSIAAVTLTLVAFVPYIRAIINGTTKPHVFSWIIWGISTLVVFLAQLAANGGVGAWPTGISGVITLFIAFLAYTRRADIAITKFDWLCFLLALLSLPFWYVMSNPLWAVVILTVVDVLGFAPTIRKAYAAPYSESLSFYALFSARNVLAIIALEQYSLTTVLFPLVVTLACVMLMGMLVYRRRVI